MTTFTPAEPAVQARHRVLDAVKALVPACDIVELPAFPGAATTWPTPAPMAGFNAARQVVALAEQEVHKYAVQLRGEGLSWRDLADLMEIPWSEEYSRPERTFELVAGPDDGSAWSRGPTVSWHCGGPDGCGERITDRGPYNGYPSDDQDGHDSRCHRLEAEINAYEREQADRERRDAVMDEAYARLAVNSIERATADRARYVVSHGGRYLGWSTSESLAVGLVLNDAEALKRNGYPDRNDAIRRVGVAWMGSDPEAWLALIRAAATGE